MQKCLCAYLYTGAGGCESSTDLVFTGHNLICENGKILVDTETEFKKPILNQAIIDVQKLSNERRKMNTFYSEVEGYESVFFDLEVTKTSLESMSINKNPFIPSSKLLMDQHCQKILNLQAQGLLRRLDAIKCKKL